MKFHRAHRGGVQEKPQQDKKGGKELGNLAKHSDFLNDFLT